MGRWRRGFLTHHAVWLRKISTWRCCLPPRSFPGSQRHPFAPSLHPKASEKKNPFHCSVRFSPPLAWPCLSLSKTRAQQFSRTAAPPSLPPKVLPPPHHAQGVLSENKEGSAAKASLTDTHLRLDIPLERLPGHPGAGPALDGKQGFPWILTHLHSDLADTTSVLRS